MERIRYNKNDIKVLYKINKTTEIVLDTAIGNTESIATTEVIKQASIFGPTMSCVTTAKVNDVGEKVGYKYEKIEIGMSIYIDEISVEGETEEVKKGKRNCAKNQTGKENEIQFRQRRVYGSKGRQKGRRNIRTNEGRERSKKQEMQTIRNHNK